VVVPSWFPMNEPTLRLVAAWLPNLLFTALGGWLYVKAPK
jgi:lipopolysaccharide export LptBFGC system permease protein LptF